MAYNNPGLAFLKSHGPVETVDDVLAYVDFLRKEVGITGEIPVQLDRIWEYFNIPEPIIVALPDIQGLLVDPDNGIIIINSEDPINRQKFSQAHELIEILFSVLPQGKNLGNGWKLKKPGGFAEFEKETICNFAAASLLMPIEYVKKMIQSDDVTFACARVISAECNVSLSAALVQLTQISSRKHTVVLWKMKNKPSEIKNKIPDMQLSFLDEKLRGPMMKLRVEWSMGNTYAPFIPKDKSIEESSLTYRAWQSGNYTSGKERLCLDGRKTKLYLTQNLPFTNKDETRVLSVIEDLS
jgi:Zn-dependent peptidase ImmA (M78 family)